MWLDSQLEDYLLSISPTHTDSLTSAAKAQLLGGTAITAQTPLFLSASAIRRPYSVDSAYHQSLVAEPTVVPSPRIPQAHYPHKHDGCKRFWVRNSWWDGKTRPSGSVVPRYCCRGATECMRHTFCEQHRLHTTEQSQRAGFTIKMQRLNRRCEERQLYAKQKTIFTQEEMMHLGFFYSSVYKLDV